MDETYHRVLIEACYRLGGEAAFAQQTGYALQDVLDLLMRKRPVSLDLFRKSVDIVLVYMKRGVHDVIDADAFLEEVRRRNNLP